MILCNTQGATEKEKYYFKMASQNKVDGIICVSYSEISVLGIDISEKMLAYARKNNAA